MSDVCLQLVEEGRKPGPNPSWGSIESVLAGEADNLDRRQFDSLGHSETDVWGHQKTETGS